MELVFAFPQGLLGALELFNIQIHSDPLQYGSIARPERFGAAEEPAVASFSGGSSSGRAAAHVMVDIPAKSNGKFLSRM